MCATPHLSALRGGAMMVGSKGDIKMNRMRRSAWLAMAACGAFNALAFNAQAESLPQRNLLVEWRMNSASAQQNQGGGLRSGEVTVDSRSGVTGRGNVVITSTTRTTTAMGLQQLQVLNGGQARLYLGNSRPVSQWQFGLSGSGLVAAGNPPGSQHWQAWQSTTMVDTGRGLTVRPRWSGGRQVTVELEARVAQQTPYAPEGQTESSEVMTTVQIPLGEWTAVARRGGQTQQRQRGVLSTEDISRDESEVLEMRISAP